MDLQDSIIIRTQCFSRIKDTNILISDKMKKGILFSIKENETATLINSSKNYIIYIENIDDGNEIKIDEGETFIINDSDHSYPAMEYRVKIYNKLTNSSSLYLYKIEHLSSTNDEQYKTMISSIIDYDENLLFDDDVKYLSGKRVYKAASRQLHTMITFIVDNCSLIVNSLNKIYDNPVLKDKRVVVETSVIKKQSSRTLIKNFKSVKEDKYYSTRIIQDADIELNRYLIYMLRFSKIRLDELIIRADIELKNLNAKENKILAKSSDQTKKKHTQYQIDILEKKKKRINDFLKCSKYILNSIDRLLELNDLKKIEASSKRDNSICYHSWYLNIERYLFLILFQGYTISFSTNYSSILSISLKTTYKLFEAYCLLSIDAAITELGFENLEDEIDYNHIIKKFVKDDFSIELMYEIDAKDVSLVKKDEVYYINSNTKHISPDFCLVLKEKDVPVLFLVLDAKCRKSYSINRSIVEGDYNHTIRDYLSLRYSTNDRPFVLPKIVDSFWLLLPEDKNDEQYECVNQLEYEYVKLKLDGQEEQFIEKINDYFSLILN